LREVSLCRLFYVTWKRCTVMAGCCGSLFVGHNFMDQSSEPHSWNHMVGLSYEGRAGVRLKEVHSAQYTRSDICKSLVCNSVAWKYSRFDPKYDKTEDGTTVTKNFRPHKCGEIYCG